MKIFQICSSEKLIKREHFHFLKSSCNSYKMLEIYFHLRKNILVCFILLYRKSAVLYVSATWSISIKLNDSLPSYTKNDSISFQWSNVTQKTDATATLGQITRFQSSHLTNLKHINLFFKWLVEQYNAAAFSRSSNMNGLHATRVNEKSLRSFFPSFSLVWSKMASPLWLTSPLSWP